MTVIVLSLLFPLSTVSAMQDQRIATSIDTASLILPPGDIQLEYLRILQLKGEEPTYTLAIQPFTYHATLRPYSEGSREAYFQRRFKINRSGNLSWRLLPVQLTSIFNSDYPQGQNNRGLWAGRGLSTRMDLGVYASWNALTIQLAPSIYYSQNKDFAILPENSIGYSTFISPFYPTRIDMPQRFGTDRISHIGWGQSFLAFNFAGLSARFGAQNLWWGPARFNPILMGNNAEGFPHFSINSATPVNFLNNRWEFSMIWGKLTESEWFDDNPQNDKRFITGLIVDVHPEFLPGLTLGGARVFYKLVPDNGMKLKDYLVFFESIFKRNKITPENPTGDDEADQMLSVFGRWVFPKSGLELYLEWARNDHNWDLRDFLQEPDHSRAYTFGIQKLFTGQVADYVLGLEISQLGRSLTTIGRASPPYYTHHKVRQGFTHKGLVLAAPIGPGSESQRIEFKRLSGRASIEASIVRIRWNNDWYFETIAPSGYYNIHDTSHIITLGASIFLDGIVLSPHLAYTWQMNRNYLIGADAHNLNIGLALTFNKYN